MKLPCNALDTAYNVDDNTLAVTTVFSYKRCIIIIDMEKKQIKKAITLDSNSYGVALKDSRLIYSGDRGIRMINPYDDSISDIIRDERSLDCYIATFGNKIYHTNN